MTFVERVSDFVKRSAVIRVILGFALAAGVLLLVGWLVTGPGRSYAGAIDAPIRSSIRQMQSPLWTSLFLTVTKLGSTLYLAVIGSVIGVAFLYLRMFRPFVIFVITMAGQAILHNGAKLVIPRSKASAFRAGTPSRLSVFMLPPRGLRRTDSRTRLSRRGSG